MDHNFYPLKVVRKKLETPEAVSLFFEVSEDSKDTFAYKQGQYLTLKFDINGEPVRRSYSMCSSPVDDQLAVTVKKVPNGLVSNYIFDYVEEGQTIEVMPPQGRFFTELAPDHRKTYYLIGAGSGITPLFSILKTILEEEPQSSVFLLYGNRNESSIIYKETLDQLAEKYAGQLKVEHVLTKPQREKKKGITGLFSKGKMNWTGRIGRINNLVVNDFLKENPAPYPDAEYFICGPGDMIDLVHSELIRIGVDEDHIHQERFVTKPTGNAKLNTGVEGAVAKVHLDGRTVEVVVPANKSILDVLIEQKLDPPYSCTSGACSTCMAKVLSGSVKMEVCYALDDDEVKEGYILSCQAHPTSKEVEVTFDV